MEIRDAPKQQKIKKARRMDCIRLDVNDRTYFTDEGYLVDHPVLTSCGIFEYVNPDGSIRRELRIPKYVFDEKSLKTYKGKPVIITHEAGVVDKNNVDKEQIGTILSDGYQDGDNVRAEIIIHNTDALKECGLRELSLGYNLDLVEEPGVWKGEPYDAVQTNIVINHLALVASARAGEQARLNIDSSDEPVLKGGKKMAKTARTSRNDGGMMTPEELQKAVSQYKARKSGRVLGKKEMDPDLDGGASEGTADPDEKDDKAFDGDDKGLPETDPAPDKPAGSTPQDIMQKVKDRRDRRDSFDDPEDPDHCMGVIAQQDEDIDMLLACLEKILSERNQDSDGCGKEPDAVDGDGEENTDCGKNKDGSDDQSKSLNADSADELFRQRLSICRIGDKLRMDGLENMAIPEAKKAVIAKVLPSMNLDGKSRAYVDAAYDLAVGEVNKRKDVNYQRRQMTGAHRRMDGMANPANASMAASARQRMIEREEGGNE